MFSTLILAAAMSVFSDDFVTNQTLAEHWLVEGDVKSEDGVLKLGKGGKVTWRGEVPEKYVLTWKEGADRKPMRRDCTKAENPKVVFRTRGELIIDDVQVTLVQDENASPNLVINSGFEYDHDGVPLYYCNRSNFRWGDKSGEEYEQWLRAFMVDTSEKHSGNQSLKVTVDSLTSGFWFYPWRTMTQKGATGVFTAWMKSSRPGMKVDIAFGGAPRQTMELTQDWARYEVVSTNMPAPNLFSPVYFYINDCAKQEGLVWIDDIQLEYGDKATPYRPSDLDPSRFGKREQIQRPATVQVKKLPDGVKPTIELEKWEPYAVDAGHFWYKRQEPIKLTKAFLACDDDNLYIAYRNFGENRDGVNHKHFDKNSTSICMIDSVEILLRPTEEKKNYHLFCAPNGDLTDAYAENLSWDGHATVQARNVEGAVEYLVTVPFADLAPNGFTSHWMYNLGRNDRLSPNVQCTGTSFTKQGDFREDSYWATLDLPAEVSKKWEGVAAARKADAKAEIVSRLDYYMTEPEARFRVYDEAGKVEEVAVDISQMACGTNSVALKAHGRDWTAAVVKLPYWKGAVQRNHFARCIERNGEKILMAANCLLVRENPAQADGHHEALSLLAKRGFKNVHLCAFSDRKMVEQMRAMAEEAGRLGMDVLLWTDDKDGKEYTRAETREKLYDLENVISRVATDEPELGKESDVVKAYMLQEKSHYPYCPVQMNNTSFGFPSRFADLTTDIFMLDAYYTAAEFGTLDGALRNVDVMVKSNRSTPCWFFLTGVNTLHYKQPSYAEQLAQCWSALCAGCSGVTWFVNMVSAEGNWKAMCDFNREAQELKDFLLTEEITPPALCSIGDDLIRSRTSKKGEDWYLFTVNIDEGAVEKAEYTLPAAAPQNGTAEVLFENRTVEVKDGKIVDSYAPFARHIYKILKDNK